MAMNVGKRGPPGPRNANRAVNSLELWCFPDVSTLTHAVQSSRGATVCLRRELRYDRPQLALNSSVLDGKVSRSCRQICSYTHALRDVLADLA